MPPADTQMNRGIQVRKLKADAAQEAAKGKHKKALEKYLELERLEPREGGWARRAGEMYRQLGRVDDGIAAFHRAADKYADSGLVAKASAVCQTILRMRPGDDHARARLERLRPAAAYARSRSTSVAGLLRDSPSAGAEPAPAAAAGGGNEAPRVRADGTRPPPVPRELRRPAAADVDEVVEELDSDLLEEDDEEA